MLRGRREHDIVLKRTRSRSDKNVADTKLEYDQRQIAGAIRPRSY